MALEDLFGDLLETGAGFLQNQLEQKELKKMAKLRAAAFAPTSFPTLGTGAMSFAMPGGVTALTDGLFNNNAVTQALGLAPSSRAPQTIEVGGKVYVNRGRALLYSGDLSACKRVRKIASRAHRAQGSRRPR